MSGLRWRILVNKLGYFFASDRQHLLDSAPVRFTVDLVFKFVRLMAVGYVADCQRSILPLQYMEGGAREIEKLLVFGPEWDCWIFWRPITNVKVLFFPVLPGIKRNIALSEDSQTLPDCPFDQNSINMKMRVDCHHGGPILMKGQSMWRGWRKWCWDMVFSECFGFLI